MFVFDNGVWYHPERKNSETETKYYEPTKKKFDAVKEIKIIDYSEDGEETIISRHVKFDRKGTCVYGVL